MTPLKQQISLFILGFRLVLPSGEHVLGLGLGLLLSSGERGGRDANFIHSRHSPRVPNFLLIGDTAAVSLGAAYNYE